MSASEIHFTGGQGAIWIQPDGPATDMVFLGCHEIASLEEPLGDYTPFFCPNPEKPKDWISSGEIFAPPEAVTAQILEDVTGALSYLEMQKCPFPLYINMVCSGRKDVFTNYERTFILDTRRITNRSYENVALRDTDERTSVTHSVSAAPPLIKVVKLSAVEQDVPTRGGA
jgi:hypothetical protein